MPQITARDDTHRYLIEVPPDAEVRLDHQGRDWVSIPDHEVFDGETIWYTDFLLIEGARIGGGGMRLVSEEPLERDRDVEHSGQDVLVVNAPQGHERLCPR